MFDIQLALDDFRDSVHNRCPFYNGNDGDLHIADDVDLNTMARVAEDKAVKHNCRDYDAIKQALLAITTMFVTPCRIEAATYIWVVEQVYLHVDAKAQPPINHLSHVLANATIPANGNTHGRKPQANYNKQYVQQQPFGAAAAPAPEPVNESRVTDATIKAVLELVAAAEKKEACEFYQTVSHKNIQKIGKLLRGK